MPTFTYRANYGAQLSRKPRMTKTEFGDGYVQRVRAGINTNPEEWSLNFQRIDNTEADEIMAFLDAQAGALPFDWTSPTGTSRRYLCEEYSRTYGEEGYSSINAKFVQFFG